MPFRCSLSTIADTAAFISDLDVRATCDSSKLERLPANSIARRPRVLFRFR